MLRIHTRRPIRDCLLLSSFFFDYKFFLWRHWQCLASWLWHHKYVGGRCTFCLQVFHLPSVKTKIRSSLLFPEGNQPINHLTTPRICQHSNLHREFACVLEQRWLTGGYCWVGSGLYSLSLHLQTISLTGNKSSRWWVYNFPFSYPLP